MPPQEDLNDVGEGNGNHEGVTDGIITAITGTATHSVGTALNETRPAFICPDGVPYLLSQGSREESFGMESLQQSGMLSVARLPTSSNAQEMRDDTCLHSSRIGVTDNYNEETIQMGTIEDETHAVLVFAANDERNNWAHATADINEGRVLPQGTAYVHQISGPSSASINHMDSFQQQATVVAIADGFHSNSLGAVQAELIGQDFSASVSHISAPERLSAAVVHAEQESETYGAFEGVQTTEATVIDSVPLDQPAEVADWKINGEAQVLANVTTPTHSEERKRPANVSANSTGRMAVNAHPRTEPAADSYAFMSTDATPISQVVGITGQQAEVIVIQDDVHPHEYPDEAEAELIGRQPGLASLQASLIIDDTLNYDHQAEVLAIQDDLHPLEFANSSEAELVGTAVSYNTAFLTGTHMQVAEASPALGSLIVESITLPSGSGLDQQAEVIDVQEDYHPDEYVSGDSAQAELIGADYSFHLYSPDTNQGVPSRATAESYNIAEELANALNNISSQTAIAATPVGSGSICATPVHPSSIGSAAILESATALDESPWPQKPSPSPFTPLQEHVERPDWLHETPTGRPLHSTEAEASFSSASEPTFQRHSIHSLSSQIARGTTNVIETLFGDSKPPFVGRRRSDINDAADAVTPRTLLPWSVIYSPSTHMWVATIQTNQKALDKNSITEASKSLRAFSLPTDKAAIALARAWTPPRMQAKTNSCHICRARFALLRRAWHCRNCGVVVCKECSVVWPAKMVPDTYNIKKESSVNICRSCDWLSNSFRLALLEGNRDKAVALHATGNVNLHAPFGNVKGELLYPVHCAVLGGSLSLLRWLVDENCCPIKSLRISGVGRDSSGTYTPIVTSKGRSLLGIALENRNIDIVRYLVVKKGISLAGEQDITFEMLLRNLDKVLRMLPEEGLYSAETSDDARSAMREADASQSSGIDDEIRIAPRSFEDDNVRSVSDEARDLGALRTDTDHQDDCIICFDSKIDCVATPCGHQICCLTCSTHISRCPVCSSSCKFMRVFKP